jgi:hypothetical protein
VPPPSQKRQFFTERGTSPAPMMMMEKKEEEEDFNASLGRLIQFTSIGVDTRDLLPQDEGHITREHLFMDKFWKTKVFIIWEIFLLFQIFQIYLLLI